MAIGTTRSGVGFRHITLFSLNASGYPNGVATDTPYEGVQLTGARSLTINDPEPQQIVHVGDDRPFALDVLPPTEPITGEMVGGKINDTIDALLSDDKSALVGDGAAYIFPFGSDSRGDENVMGVLCYRQSIDTDPTSSTFGDRRWEFRLFPKAFIITREGGLTPDPEERTYTVRPQFITTHLWGTSLSTSTEGCEQAQGFRGIATYKPRIATWIGDTTVTEFDFNTAFPAADTASIAAWVDGVLDTTATKKTDGVEFASAPDTDAMVVVFYEHNV